LHSWCEGVHMLQRRRDGRALYWLHTLDPVMSNTTCNSLVPPLLCMVPAHLRCN
jgi:hypothetical protein